MVVALTKIWTLWLLHRQKPGLYGCCIDRNLDFMVAASTKPGLYGYRIDRNPNVIIITL